jgi:hypothetical protein
MIPTPLKKIFSFLRPVIFNDFFLLVVIVVLLYVQARYNRLENEALMTSVQAFVFGAIAENKREHLTELNTMRNMIQRQTHSDKDSGTPRVMHFREAAEKQNRGGDAHRSTASSDNVVGMSFHDIPYDEDEEEDEEEDINDEIRNLFRCLNADDGGKLSSKDTGARPPVTVTEIDECEEHDEHNEHNEHNERDQQKERRQGDDGEDGVNCEKDGEIVEKVRLSSSSSLSAEDERMKRMAEVREAAFNEVSKDVAREENVENIPDCDKNRSRDQQMASPVYSSASSHLTTESIPKMKLPELKKSAADLGLDSKGTKDVLVSRILSSLSS